MALSVISVIFSVSVNEATAIMAAQRGAVSSENKAAAALRGQTERRRRCRRRRNQKSVIEADSLFFFFLPALFTLAGSVAVGAA